MEPNPDTQPVARTLPDEELVQRVLAGDLVAFEALMRRHNPRVYRTVRALIRDEAEVEDVMQQAYLAAFANLRSFRGDAAFSTWLLRIARNEAETRRKRGLRVVSLELDKAEDEAAMVDGRPRPDAAAETREITALAESAIDALPESLRSVFMLRGVDGLSTAEAAAVLGVSEDVIKQRLHRAREAVRGRVLERMDAQIGEAFEFRAPRCDRVVTAVLTRLNQGGKP